MIAALRPTDFATVRGTELLRARLEGKDTWVAEQSSKCVGYAWRSQFFAQDFLESLYVLENYRRIGVASALIDAFEQARRTPKLFVSTNRSNNPMRILLTRRGYAASGAIYNAMVIRKRHRQNHAWHKFLAIPDRLHGGF